MNNGLIPLIFVILISIGMVVFGSWMLIQSMDSARKSDEYYLNQFATNQTWVDSLKCEDIAKVYGAGTVIQAKSTPLFKNLGIQKECPQFNGVK